MSENLVLIPIKGKASLSMITISLTWIDCSNCQRRRIKCDRTWPGCRKCGKRCLECLGYGLKLKWD
ncbi:unnamed protein product [Penicillium salamii]|uniref:Zn(2)-C6 fungal-type domain-containing protein n=1 Tax=Penicillium salamii TaxID=1612424 RepID=A0A9W4NWT9_9EURO|nr:unnamed protein product [Penicillium salamii]